MTKFKVGDKVRRIKGFNVLPAGVYTVRKLSASGEFLYLEEPSYSYYDQDFFELVVADPIEEAKAILEAAGYGITDPKPKLNGQVVVYEMDGRIHSTLKENWDRWERTGTLGRCVALAIVDWTEGEGL